MSFSDFAGSREGSLIGAILREQGAIRRMEALSNAGRPALLAVAGRIEQVAPSLSNTDKQHVGRYVHRVLGPRGWRPVDKKRLPKGGLFVTASVFARVGAAAQGATLAAADDAPPAMDALSRIAAARALVRQLPVKPHGVEAFLADKRRAAKLER